MNQKKNICNIIKIMFLPDVHFGNTKVSPEKIREHFIKYVYSKLDDIQILVIGGDFFHTLLNMNSEAGVMSVTVIDELIALARIHKFYIRVIRGTFSHDRRQNRFWNINISDELNNKPLVKVIDNLNIELFDNWDITMMYCPDDQPYNDLTGAVIEYIQSQGFNKIDILCSHGYFEHLLPQNMDHVPTNTLKWSSLSKYIKGCVLNGHVHTHSVVNNVVSGGSFERFAHGEEEDKGYYIITYDIKKHKVTNYDFIINHDATPFITIKTDKFETEEKCIEYVDTLINNIRKQFNDEYQDIYLCIVGNQVSISNYIKSNYINVHVKHKQKVVNQLVELEFDTSYDDLPKITEDNLAQLVWNKLKDINNISEILTFEEVKEILDNL